MMLLDLPGSGVCESVIVSLVVVFMVEAHASRWMKSVGISIDEVDGRMCRSMLDAVSV